MSKKKKKNSNHVNSSVNNNKINDTNSVKMSEIDKQIKNEIIAKKIEKDNEEEVRRKNELNERSKSYYSNSNNTSSAPKKMVKRKHPVVNFFLVVLAFIGIGYFFSCLCYGNGTNSLKTLVEGLLLVLFTFIFIVVSYTINRNNKNIILLGSLLLIGFYSIEIGTISGYFSFPSFKTINDFNGKSLNDVVKWAEDNKVQVNQDYEYSDMVPEYSIISQNIKAGTRIKDAKNLVVAVSEGPNPEKEVIVSDMIGWDTERVLNYVLENHLSNVDISFVESEKQQDTVIDQNKSGNLKRNDKIELTFSAGEEFDNNDVKLIDFTNKSKFEVTLYLEQHRIKYEFKDKFSSKIKKGFAVSQSIKPGKKVKVNDENVDVYFSKGPKIKVPDLKKLSISEVTKWIIENKLKLEFSNKYDDSAKENEVLEVNHSKGDIVQQGDTIKLVISKGKLKMVKFNSLNEFRDWADKYSISYEEKHEFSDDIESGNVISYSYKPGDVIKNNDSIIVTISDGKKLEVPDLKGLTKDNAISKLKNAGLDYNFVSKSSNSVDKGKVISQSISGGSSVSKGTTVTVTISSGKSTSTTSNRVNNYSGGSSNNNNNNNNNSSNNNDSCERKTYNVGRELNNIFKNYNGYSAVSSAIYSFFSSHYPGVKLSISGTDGGDSVSGSYISGTAGPGATIESCNGRTYTIILAK